jgi:GAF domain-containing protein
MENLASPAEATLKSDARQASHAATIWSDVAALHGNPRAAGARYSHAEYDPDQQIFGSVSECVEAARLSRIRAGFLVATADSSTDGSAEALSQLLLNIRCLLQMDIAFVSEFAEGRRIFRLVDAAPASEDLMQVGQSHPLEETYCQRIVDGRLPRAIQDSTQFPEANRLEATRALRIAAYLSAPVKLSSGEVYGTLCCISHAPRSAMGSLQVDALQSVAGLVAKEIERQRDRR